MEGQLFFRRVGGISKSLSLNDLNAISLIDATDPTSVFPSSNGGVEVTTNNDPVGLILNKSHMGDKTAAQFIADQPELVTNGDFSAGLTGWTDTSSAGGVASVVDGALNLTNTTGTCRAQNAGVFTVGKYYMLTCDVSNAACSSYYGASVSIGTLPIGHNQVVFLTSDASADAISLRNFAAGTTSIVDNISIKEIPGQHMSQETASKRALWRVDGSFELDGVDDGYEFGPVAGVEYVAASMVVLSGYPDLSTLLAKAELSDANSIRIFGGEFRDPSNLADANDFSDNDGNTFVNSVDTPAFTTDVPFVGEWLSGSLSEKEYGALGLPAVTGRAGKFRIYKKLMLDYVPSDSERQLIRKWLADHTTIEELVVGQPERVINGGFDVDLSSWTLASTDANNSVVWDNGRAAFDFNGDTGLAITQEDVFEIGEWYLVTFNASDIVGSGLKIQSGTDANISNITTDGNYSIVHQADGEDLFVYRRVGGSAGSAKIDNISVKQIPSLT